jgi:hypothetical protein
MDKFEKNHVSCCIYLFYIKKKKRNQIHW